MIFFEDAFASSAGAGGESMSSLLILVVFMVSVYFIVWRPQNQQVKAQKDMLSKLAVGDEVITSGGILGKVKKLKENFVVITVNDASLTTQKSAVAKILPKGTINSIE